MATDKRSTSLGLRDEDAAGKLNEKYQQCATEIKMENRFLGPLQIHQESMMRLTKPVVGSDHGKKKQAKALNLASRNVDPVVAIRSLFALRRTRRANTDPSMVVLPGRRASAFLPVESDGGSIHKLRTLQMRQELEGLSDLESDESERSTYDAEPTPRTSSSQQSSSDLDSIASLKNPNEGKSRTGGQETDQDAELSQQVVGRGRSEKLSKRRSSLFSVDERRASVNSGGVGGGSSCDNSLTNGVLRRISSAEGKDGASLICKFPSRGNSPGYGGDDDTLICDWGRRQSNASSTYSVSNPEELFQERKKGSESLICGWNESELSILSDSSVDEKVLRQAVESCTLFDSHRR